MKNFERPKSLTELVSETLRDWIISGDLELGSQLSEARIASEMQVSRTPVREAINRLEMEGLLIVEPQRGSFVFSLEPTELAKLCDARLCLESAAMIAAIRHDPDRLAQQLGECVDKMTAARAADDVPAYLQLDSRFHQILLDESDNRFLNDAYQTIAQKMSALRNRLGRHPDHMAKSYREHIEMRDAVAARDTDKALAILRDHIGQNEGSYWKMATSR
ncbi:GntR family transcriptional regulator [Albibacillus kandeliae]|uniref:GntR family transcriptional regulator n=1 Tax=Albibacillus kandeliae TaxID=2174228 RepID=UPI000D68C165|nr:GntR family transcriptional regulator [Albibacillus kandeliae]